MSHLLSGGQLRRMRECNIMLYGLLLSHIRSLEFISSERDEGFSECWLLELAGWLLVTAVWRELWSLLYTAVLCLISQQKIEKTN